MKTLDVISIGAGSNFNGKATYACLILSVPEKDERVKLIKRIYKSTLFIIEYFAVYFNHQSLTLTQLLVIPGIFWDFLQ